MDQSSTTSRGDNFNHTHSMSDNQFSYAYLPSPVSRCSSGELEHALGGTFVAYSGAATSIPSSEIHNTASPSDTITTSLHAHITPPPAAFQGTNYTMVPSSPLRDIKLQVLKYSPAEGHENAYITANVQCQLPDVAESVNPNSSNGRTAIIQKPVMLRLVLGRRPLRTEVFDAPPINALGDTNQGFSLRIVRAVSLPFSETGMEPNPSGRNTVPLVVQALRGEEILESLIFGSFTYQNSEGQSTGDLSNPLAGIKRASPDLSGSPERRRRLDNGDLHVIGGNQKAQPIKLRVIPPRAAHNNAPLGHVMPRAQSHSVGAEDNHLFPVIPPEAVRPPRPAPKRAVTHLPFGNEKSTSIEWVTINGGVHPTVVVDEWSAEEIAEGRKLIRFTRLPPLHPRRKGGQEPSSLRIECTVVSQDDIQDKDCIVSCILEPEQSRFSTRVTRERRDERPAYPFFLTSVDLIYLFENLSGKDFSTDDKNRIRRNLESLKPTTVGKQKLDSELLFQRIMNFPPPKPRNIEKDLKVFEWRKVSEAIEKVVPKYDLMKFQHPPLHQTNSEPLLGASLRRSSRRQVASLETTHPPVTVSSHGNASLIVPRADNSLTRTASNSSQVSSTSSHSDLSITSRMNSSTGSVHGGAHAGTNNSHHYSPYGGPSALHFNVPTPGSTSAFISDGQTMHVSQASSPPAQAGISGVHPPVQSPSPQADAMAPFNNHGSWSPASSINGHGSDGTSSPEADPFDVFGPGSEMSHAHQAAAVSFDQSCGVTPYDSMGLSFNFEYFQHKPSSELNPVSELIPSSQVSDCSNTPTLQPMEPIYQPSGVGYAHELNLRMTHLEHTYPGHPVDQLARAEEVIPLPNAQYSEGLSNAMMHTPTWTSPFRG